ncbi:MAG TPA: hypothetical protein VGZ22_27615 [Isosphaeraceae bacterium]|jgi:hypothetical protein|nr:hypothetical protein [Isosphaeraceae bacterium]
MMLSRIRIRLRTVMIGIALLSPLLYAGADICRYGGWDGFKEHHARIASDCSLHGAYAAERASDLRSHTGPGHSCAECNHFDKPITELIAEEERLRDEKLRCARWHEFLAFGRPVGQLDL